MRCSTSTEEASKRAGPCIGAGLAVLTGVVVLALSGTAWAKETTAHYRVIGYATGWNPQQDGTSDKINTLIFAFAEIKGGRIVLDEAAAKRLRALIALKRRDPGLKVDISVGGWGAGGFSEAASTKTSRETFAESAARLVVANHADGLDIDWEYPGHSESGIASSREDRGDFTLLLRNVHKRLDTAGAAQDRHYTLSLAVADGPFVSGIDIAAVNRLVQPDELRLLQFDDAGDLPPYRLACIDACASRRAHHQSRGASVPRRRRAGAQVGDRRGVLWA
jgi:chitinase